MSENSENAAHPAEDGTSKRTPEREGGQYAAGDYGGGGTVGEDRTGPDAGGYTGGNYGEGGTVGEDEAGLDTGGYAEGDYGQGGTVHHGGAGAPRDAADDVPRPPDDDPEVTDRPA